MPRKARERYHNRQEMTEGIGEVNNGKSANREIVERPPRWKQQHVVMGNVIYI